MKNLIALLASVVICGNSADAQITLDYTFPTPSTYPSAVLFTSNGTKIMANETGAIKLYNADYSLWKSIPLTIVPTGATLYTVSQVSDKLFNSDDLVEAYVSWYTTSPTVYHGVVIDETGGVIQDMGNSAFSWVHYINSAHKLFVYAPGTTETKVYSLPGELPCGHCGAGSVGIPKTTATGNASPIVYPNPAGDNITIVHGMPVTATGILTINAADGRQLGTWPVSGKESQIHIDVKAFPAGFYNLTILADGMPPAYSSFVK